MKNSVKPKDNYYVDSTGIVHNRNLLSDLLEKSVVVTSNQTVIKNTFKISYGAILHSFSTSGTITKDIDITELDYTTVYSVQVTLKLTYIDTAYMKDSMCYLHSYSNTEIRVNLVNAYPSNIGFIIEYLIIGI